MVRSLSRIEDEAVEIDIEGSSKSRRYEDAGDDVNMLLCNRLSVCGLSCCT